MVIASVAQCPQHLAPAACATRCGGGHRARGAWEPQKWRGRRVRSSSGLGGLGLSRWAADPGARALGLPRWQGPPFPRCQARGPPGSVQTGPPEVSCRWPLCGVCTRMSPCVLTCGLRGADALVAACVRAHACVCVCVCERGRGRGTVTLRQTCSGDIAELSPLSCQPNIFSLHAQKPPEHTVSWARRPRPDFQTTRLISIPFF